MKNEGKAGKSRIFVFKGELSQVQPVGTYIHSIVYDEERGINIARCKRTIPVVGLVLLTLLIIAIGLPNCFSQSYLAIGCGEVLYATPDRVGLNISYLESNKVDSGLCIELVHEGAALIETVYLEMGHSVAYVDFKEEMLPGSYLCDVMYSWKIGIFEMNRKHSVLLVVE